MLKRAAQTLAPLLRLFFGGVGEMHVRLDSPTRLVIESRELLFKRVYVFDANRRVVLRDERLLARFNQIRSIEMRVFYGQNGKVIGYRLALHRGWLDNPIVGSTEDDAQASIVAARISTITGAKVLSMMPPWLRR